MQIFQDSIAGIGFADESIKDLFFPGLLPLLLLLVLRIRRLPSLPQLPSPTRKRRR